MTTNTSSTAVATSDLAQRVGDAMKTAIESLSPERLMRIQEIKKRVDELSEKGLLRREKFSEASSADLRKRYFLGQEG